MLVQRRHLAAGAEAGVDGQHAPAAQRRGQQQAAQVPREHADGVRLGAHRQFLADLALQAGQQQPRQGVNRHGAQEVGVRVVGQRQPLQRRLLHALLVELHLDRQRVFLLAAVDRQDAVRRDVAHRLVELEVALVLAALTFGEFFALGRADFAAVPQHVADGGAHVGRLGDLLGEDVADAGQHVLGGVQLLLGVDQRAGHLGEVRHHGVARPHGDGERLQAALAGGGRQRALLRLVREVKVFEALGALGGGDGGAQLVGQPALVLDALEDGVLALGELPLGLHAPLHGADDFLVEPAGALLTVARDERDGVALVEQVDHGLDLQLADLQVLGDAREVQVLTGGGGLRHHGRLHCSSHPRPGSRGFEIGAAGRVLSSRPTLARLRAGVKRPAARAAN